MSFFSCTRTLTQASDRGFDLRVDVENFRFVEPLQNIGRQG